MNLDYVYGTLSNRRRASLNYQSIIRSPIEFLAVGTNTRGEALIIAPYDTCGINTLTKYRNALKKLYEKGYQEAKAINASSG